MAQPVVTLRPTPLSEWNGRILAIANNKGGVKKTSLVANVAGQLAAGGFRVLVVALDTQEENLATDLGYLKRSDHGASLAQAMIAGDGAVSVIDNVRANLDVIADGPTLETVVADTYGSIGRGEATYEDLVYSLLHPVVEPLAPAYDLVLIDCPPGNKVLVDAALGVARWVLIPTASDAGSIRSMRGTAKAFVAARECNPTIELLGVVLAGSGTQATVVRGAAQAEVNQMFGGQAPLFTQFLRYAEAPAVRARQYSLLMHEMETTSSAGLAQDYLRITQEVVERITVAEGSHR